MQIEELEDSARRSDAKTHDFTGGEAKAYRLLNQNASIDAENLTKEITSMDFKVLYLWLGNVSLLHIVTACRR